MSWPDSLAQQVSGGELPLAASFVVALLGGLVAGLGPCVLPMVPAIFGYVVGHAGDTELGRTSTARAFGLSAAFVLGMSGVFASVGVTAGLLGRALIVGAWAYYAAASVCVVLGLHMLGVIDLPFSAINRLLPARRPERRGVIGAFMFGMLFGVVASPCSTPILATIATLAAVRGSAAEGGALLFVYGLGKGLPLLALGVASGSLTVMQRLTGSASALTRVGGVALIGTAGYLVWIA